MSRSALLGRRLTRITAAHQAGEVERLIAETAEELGLDPTDLRHEVAALTRRCHAAGAHTQEAQIALVAGELGVSVAVIEAELAAMLER